MGLDPRDWTLRELFDMAQGKREESRELLLSQRWAIGSLFAEEQPTERQLREFLTFGGPMGAAREERHMALVDAKIAEIRANGGKVVF